MEEHKGWLLRSGDRLMRSDGSGSNDFTLRFQDNLPSGNYEVMWVTIPNTVYNVDAGRDTLTFETVSSGGGIQGTVSVPRRNYTAQELATELTSFPFFDVSTGLPTTLTWVYDPNTFRYTVRNNSADTGYLHYGDGGTLMKILGFSAPRGEEPVPYPLPPGQFVAAPNVAQLGSPLSIGINIVESKGEGFVTAGGNSQVLDNRRATLLVPFLSAAGGYSFVTKENFRQTFSLRSSGNQISVNLRDPDTGQPLNLNGADWEMFFRRAPGGP